MKLTIVAATGGIGRQLLDQALAARHDVTAVVRNAKALPRNVAVITTDLANADATALERAIKGRDAVLSGLGAREKSDTGVAWRGTRSIVLAMKAAGVRRIVVVSAAPIGTVPSPHRPDPPRDDPGDGFFMRHLLSPLTKVFLREHYADLAHMEDIVRESGLDWTIVRPPRLTDGPLTTAYRTAVGKNLRRGLVISRADVAHFMLNALTQSSSIKQCIGIAR
jgi:putative NADH-flavin reductase